MTASTTSWSLGGPQLATLHCGPLSAIAIVHENGGTVALSAWKGSKVLTHDRGKGRDDLESNSFVSVSLAQPLFAGESLELGDTYVRGADWVISFRESGRFRVAPEVYWRAEHLEEFNAVKLELITSVKTDLLDSQPASSVNTALNNATEVLQSPALEVPSFKTIYRGPRAPNSSNAASVFKAVESQHRLFVARFPQLDLSYAQLVHPTDFYAVEAAAEDESRFWLWNLIFAQSLEKGVIRRGRICGWFMPVENDLQTAVELARRFVDEPLPLTT